MPQISSLFPLVRLGIFGTVSLFSFIVFVISAHVLSLTHGVVFRFFDFAGLGVATAVLTLLTLPAMLWITRIRSGAMPSFIIVELCWIGFLWIMWLATAGSTASINGSGGSCITTSTLVTTLCSEINAIEAFAFLNWLMLIGYFAILVFLSVKSLQAGNHHIWTTPVNEANFEGGPSPNYGRDKTGAQQPTYAQQYPPTSNASNSYPATAQV